MPTTSNANAASIALDRSGAWLTPARFALILTLLVTLPFWDVLLGVKTFFFQDYELYAYPIAHYWRDCFWRGELPLWNPLNDCGVPLLAQWNSMILYPLGLIYLVFPMPWSFVVFEFLHLILAGLGMYALAYFWTQHRLSAAVAGLAFAFSGVSLNMLIWPGSMAAFGWMPWLILMSQRAWREGGRQWIKAGLIGGLQMLSGMAEIILFTWVIISVLWLAEWVRAKEGRGRMLLRYGSLAVFVAALAAAQLLPFLDLLGHSQRHSQYSTTELSVAASGWANLLVPLFRCHPTALGVYFQSGQAYFSSFYLGIGVLTLVALAAARVKDYRVWVLATLAVFTFILGMGENTFVYTCLRKAVPAIGFMNFPAKFLFVMAVIAPLLAAFALRHWCESREDEVKNLKALWVIAAAFVVLIAGVVWFSIAHPFPRESSRLTFTNGLSRLAVLALILATLWGIIRAKTSRVLIGLQACLLLLLWGDVLTHVPSQNPTVEPSVMQYGLPPLVEMKSRLASAQSRAMLSRQANDIFSTSFVPKAFDGCLGHRLGLFANCNLIDEIPKIDGFFPLYLPYEQEMLNAAMNASYGPPKGLVDFLGVSHITAPGTSLDWSTRSSALPIITAGQRPEFVTGDAALKGILSPTYNPRRLVYLPAEAQSSMHVTRHTDAKVFKRSIAAHRLSAEVEASEPSLVVVAQTYYHPWKAYVDGKPVPLWRANHAFQALEVPAGRHEIALAYEDKAFRTGATLSGLAWLGGGLGLLLRRKAPQPQKAINPLVQ